MNTPIAVITPDGKLLIAEINHELAIWNLGSYKKVKTLAFKGELSDLSVSSSRQYLAVIEAFPEDPHTPTRWTTIKDLHEPPGQTLVIWNLRNYKIVRRINFSQELRAGAIQFSPRGQILAISVARKTTGNPQYDIHLMDVRRWKMIRYLSSDDEEPPLSIAWSSDCKLIAETAYYSDAGIGTLTVWHTNNPWSFYYSDGSNYEFENVGAGPLAFVGSSHRLICGQDWLDLDSRKQTISHVVKHSDGMNPRCVILYGKENKLMLLDRWLKATNAFYDPFTVWDVQAQRVQFQFLSPYRHGNVIAVSPDASMLVTNNYSVNGGTSDGRLRLYALPAR